jgi:hypothetical protein
LWRLCTPARLHRRFFTRARTASAVRPNVAVIVQVGLYRLLVVGFVVFANDVAVVLLGVRLL